MEIATRIQRTAFPFLLAAGGLPVQAFGGWQEQAPPPWLTTLNSGVHKGRALIKAGQGVRGRAEYTNVLDNTVFINWTYRVVGLTNGPLYVGNKSTHVQEIAVDFGPTDVTGLGMNRMAVAGVTKAGRTVVRVYNFGSVKLPAILVPPGGGGQPTQLPVLEVPIQSIDTVFDRDTNGNHIGALFLNRGAVNQGVATELFLFLEDSRELYSLDLQSSQLELAASATGGGSALAVPELGTFGFVKVNDAQTNDHGCLYWFQQAGVASIVVLIDSDCDGDLDGSDVVPVGHWGLRGYGDTTSYPDGFDSAR